MSTLSFVDDLIRRAGAYAPEPKAYLRQLEIDQRAADAAADLARGSTIAMRARNAQRPFFDELADVDLTPQPKLTPRDIARARNDAARLDAQYGPFEAGSPAVLRDIGKAAERNLAEARAARAAEDAARNQFIRNTAASTGLATALGTSTAATMLSARERAAQEQQAMNAHWEEQNAARAAAAEEADLMRYGDWDEEAAIRDARPRKMAKEVLVKDLPLDDMDPLGDMVPDMPMNFDLPPAPAQSQSDTAKLKAEYKTPPGAMPRRRK